MAATTTQRTTFAIDDVPAGTRPLATERLKGSVEKVLGTPVEACDSYTAEVVEQPGFHSLVAAADVAYRGHFPLVLTPDAVWLTIAQGFARHVANHAEELRPRLVPHEGKATLRVRRDDFVRGSPENPWAEVWPAFCDQIRDHLGGEAHGLVVCDFSTTGPTERAASQVVLMDAVQSYFEYSFVSLCGIPAVTLEGAVADWEKVRERVGRLGQYDLTWWTDRVEPILAEFVQAAKGNPTPSFWKGLYKEDNGSGGPYVSGWLVRLLPYLKHRDFVCQVPNDYRTGRYTPWRTDLRNFLLERPPEGGGRMCGLKHDQLPSSVSAVPFAWHYRGETFDYQFLAGVMAVTQDADKQGDPTSDRLGRASDLDERAPERLGPGVAMKRIAFDLDETLGVPLIEGSNIVGFQARPGCLELLERLRPLCTLLLWSVSSRRYVEKCLSFGLGGCFAETHSWDELPASWKDIRRIKADLLIDDSPHHREAAAKHGLADRCVVVPVYGGPEDAADPLAWVRLVEQAVGLIPDAEKDDGR